MSNTKKEPVECGYMVGYNRGKVQLAKFTREALARSPELADPEDVTGMSPAEAKDLGERLIYVASVAESDKTDYFGRKN